MLTHLSFVVSFFLLPFSLSFLFFFFNDTATTEIYTLSLHDALPISSACARTRRRPTLRYSWSCSCSSPPATGRSEEHTSELQSPCNLVCRLLLEKKKNSKTELRSGYRTSTTSVQITSLRLSRSHTVT